MREFLQSILEWKIGVIELVSWAIGMFAAFWIQDKIYEEYAARVRELQEHDERVRK